MDLNNGLDFEKIDPTVTIINSVDTDGSFMLNNLLSRVIRQKGSNIIFLSFAQKMTHYKSIQAKLANANTLSSLMEKGEFNLIDCLELSKKIMFNGSNIELKAVLNEAFSIIRNLTDKFDFNDRKMYIFIDDLSMAHLIGIKDYEQLEFLSKIQFFQHNRKIINLLFSII